MRICGRHVFVSWGNVCKGRANTMQAANWHQGGLGMLHLLIWHTNQEAWIGGTSC